MSDWGAFPLADQTVEPPTGSTWDAFPKVSASGIGKALGVGAAKGVIGLAGMAGSAIGVDVPERVPKESAIGSAAIQRGVEGVTGEFRKPQNTAEEYAQTIGEFAPGMVGGSLGAIARNAIKYVAIPGAASEFAGQQTKGTSLEPYARAAAGVGTGLGAAAISGPAAASGVLRSRMSNDVTPALVNEARTLMQDAQARGVRLTWPEAIEQVSPGSGLPSLQRVVEGAPQSRPAMQAFYSDRPQQIEQAGRAGLNNIAPPTATPSLSPPLAAPQRIWSTMYAVRSIILHSRFMTGHQLFCLHKMKWTAFAEYLAMQKPAMLSEMTHSSIVTLPDCRRTALAFSMRSKNIWIMPRPMPVLR